MRNTFLDTLYEIAKRDPRIVFITGDLGFGVVERYMEELPNQFVNAGVAEQNMTGMTAGMALSGKMCSPTRSQISLRSVAWSRYVTTCVITRRM